MTSAPRNAQAGSVLILTLWTVVMLSMLVLVLSSEARLSAELSKSQLERTSDWIDTLTALNAAEMELLLELMPAPAEDIDPEDDDDIKDPAFRFNGEPLTLNYPHPDTVEVRIYDHAGKINLRDLTESRLQLLLENRFDDPDVRQIAELVAAWGDWLDADDGARVNGAEDTYYLELDPPYRPRQGPLETVEELLLIRGFDAVFAGVNLGAAFTLYSESETVNINTAAPDALALLPGLDTAAIEAIVASRKEQDFTQLADLEDIVSTENLVELQSWIDFATVSSTYTVLVVPKVLLNMDEESNRSTQPVFGGFAEVIWVTDFAERPFVVRIDPVMRLPALN
jgi:general secretion pathway protein K